VRKGSTSVRWDGQVSPCLALLHAHTSYLDRKERRVQAFSVGSLRDSSLASIWQSDAYRALRARLADFDFSPCVSCNSCELSESNQEDCFGNTAPTCGGCLWGQGFIQCP
jgi:MoaA/NifB/PqqE/SkfB family radical SAM enzyme